MILVKPAVLGVISFALYRLAKKAVKNWKLTVLGLLVLVAVALGVNEVLALLGGGVIGMLMLNRLRLNVNCIFILPFAGYLPHYNALWVQSDDSSLWKIFLFFLKVGAILLVLTDSVVDYQIARR